MATAFEPPPTYAEVILVDKDTQQAKFNPIWLKWFVDIAALLTTSGGGGGTIQHNLTAGLQGGTANQYYHFTAAQQTALTAGFTGTGVLVLATSPALVTPLLGTPTSGNLSNCTGSPTLTAPALGTPASGTLTNCGGLPTGGIVGGISVVITTAKLTAVGANGSMTFTNGVLTAQTPAT